MFIMKKLAAKLLLVPLKHIKSYDSIIFEDKSIYLITFKCITGDFRTIVCSRLK